VMIGVTVNTMLAVKDVLGKRSAHLELPSPATVDDLLHRMIEQWGPEMERVLIDPKTGTLHGYLSILVNGRLIGFMNGLQTKLSDGDDVFIMPPAGGGY
jgi:MoaD family protein